MENQQHQQAGPSSGGPMIEPLIEESTINPTSALPSFFEMFLVETSIQSAREALKSCIDATAINLNESASSTTSSSSLSLLKRQLMMYMSKIGQSYTQELICVITYCIERHRLTLPSSNSSIAESMYSLKRSRVIVDNNKKNNDDTNGPIMKLEPMQHVDAIRSALALSIVPYLKVKFEEFYQRERYQIIQQRQQEETTTTTGTDQQEQTQMRNHRTNVTSSSTTSSSLIRNKRSIIIQNLLQKLQSTFVTVYPFLHMTQEGLQLVYNFSYLIGRSVYYNPSLRLLGLVVRRVTMVERNNNISSNTGKVQGTHEDKTRTPPLNNTTTTNQGDGLKNSTKSSMDNKLRKALAIGTISIFIVGWIGNLRNEMRRRRHRLIAEEVQQQQVQNSTSTNTTTTPQTTATASTRFSNNDTAASAPNTDATFIAIPPPLPPKIVSPREGESDGNDGRRRQTNNHQTVVLPSDPSLCPICHEERVNPVAATSGYVFCYRCLTMHIREKGDRCPITGMLCKESQLTRIYESTEVIST